MMKNLSLKKFYYFYEMLAFKYNKKDINSSFDTTLFISKDECDKESKGIWLPSHIPVMHPFKYDKIRLAQLQCAFCGQFIHAK